ncbi:hypothetical protein LUX33_13460 [Actinomadura madurae]|uniref:acyl carrier protein n=1 Tax=Actinomadura madurae TaxID=1993 RepID=UPI0020D2076D|nr:hypothetical protein [Actinomadura madurae]MCP9949313.1 hypothetical protein [Actinomadura madurae]
MTEEALSGEAMPGEVLSGEALSSAAPAGEEPGAALDVRATVLAVLSARTGRPESLLGDGLDLEADLSIDSAGRTVIAGELAHRTGVALPEPGHLAGVTTVGEIVSWLEGRLGAAPGRTGASGRPAAGPVRRPRDERGPVRRPAPVPGTGDRGGRRDRRHGGRTRPARPRPARHAHRRPGPAPGAARLGDGLRREALPRRGRRMRRRAGTGDHAGEARRAGADPDGRGRALRRPRPSGGAAARGGGRPAAGVRGRPAGAGRRAALARLRRRGRAARSAAGSKAAAPGTPRREPGCAGWRRRSRTSTPRCSSARWTPTPRTPRARSPGRSSPSC